jgi:hypothetical protein
MTRLALIATLLLSACGSNTSLGPTVTLDENETRPERPARAYTWPTPDLIGRPCIGQGPGCYGGTFKPPGYVPTQPTEKGKP